MPKGRKPARGGRGRGGNVGGQERQDHRRPEGWSSVDQHNARFEKYYKAQNIVPDDEWQSMVDAFRDPLPTTFRITGGRKDSQTMVQTIQKEYVPFLSGLEFDGQKIDPPKQLPWYPDGLGWQLNVRKTTIRKLPQFRKFQNFLVYETEAGNISRQEAVSMIPPLFLDVEPHHYVMDMCAAPGSKTAQLVEALHTEVGRHHPANGPTDPGSVARYNVLPTGLIMANDSDSKRAHMLVHQSARLPTPNIMVTNYDASQFPNLYRMSDDGSRKVKLEFDRILCDVPCTGDGTLRKNFTIWKDWTVADGCGLHGLQFRILERAINLLKPGGRLVYSTCSLNPVENEAVVSAALRAHPEMKLVDVKDRLPELIRRAGMTTWKVAHGKGRKSQDDDEITFYESYEDLRNKQPSLLGKSYKSMWPQGDEESLGIAQCVRVYPHLQDTGGFFIAVLEKTTEGLSTASVPVTQAQEAVEFVTETALPANADATSAPSKRSADNAELDSPECTSKRAKHDEDSSAKKDADDTGMAGGFPYREDPFTYVDPNHEQVQNMLEWFGFRSDFPHDRLLVRNEDGEPIRSVYLTSSSVHSILSANHYARMRLINCGVKVFARQDSGKSGEYVCKWRELHDGMAVLRPFMNDNGKRIVKGNLAVLKFLLEHNGPLLDSVPESFGDKLKNEAPGSYVMDVEADGQEVDGVKLEHPVSYPLWRANNSCNLMLDKNEKKSLSLRLFGKDITTPPAKGNGPTKQQNASESEPTPSATREVSSAPTATAAATTPEVVEEDGAAADSQA